ncbi:MAG: hypothetical protein FWF05_04480 [Oscillospiraceae bacterium]|nr:hypothetical protein [Oscillospiraceae bacterium]
METKRITLFAGHYGSGKTNIAVNYALYLKGRTDSVKIADLDIVNPYFRTKDSGDALSRVGITVVSSAYANTNLDIPSLPQEAYATVHDKSASWVIDVGGDDRGAMALGRYAPEILAENDFEMLMVVNRFRPLTSNWQSALEVMREIETASGMKFTGVVNNSNLGRETTAGDVLSSLEYGERIAREAGLALKMVSVREDLLPSLSDKIPNMFPLKLHVYQAWK